jgi:hypothetical protein
MMSLFEPIVLLKQITLMRELIIADKCLLDLISLTKIFNTFEEEDIRFADDKNVCFKLPP